MRTVSSEVEEPSTGSPPPFLFQLLSESGRALSLTVPVFLWAIFLAALCHILYSRLGFNPTDDGLQLAFSRRILDGEIPHRDFISVRPALCYWLWAPLVASRADSLILISRAIVWLEWATIAGIWTSRAFRDIASTRTTLTEILVFCSLLFFLNAYTFPVMAWHTIDGIFLVSVALWLAEPARPFWLRCCGYFLLGCAPLAKQSFIALPVLLLFSSQDRRRLLPWLCVFTPAAFYFGWLAYEDAVIPAFTQLTAQRNFFTAAFAVYPLRYPTFSLSVASGVVLLYILRRPGHARPIKQGRWLLMGAYALFLLLPLLHLWYPEAFSIHLFGLLLGIVIGLALFRSSHVKLQESFSRFAALLVQATVLAWSAAISRAVNYPALATGILWVVFTALFYSTFFAPRLLPTTRKVLVLMSALFLATAFHYQRTHALYRESPASALTAPLDTILPGAKGIRTNPRTAAMLAELKDLVTSSGVGATRIAILPDCAAWWILSPAKNPLPLLWDNEVELPNDALRQHACQEIEKRRHTVTLLVTRYETDSLATTLRPLAPRYPLTQYVRTHWSKVGETCFFEIYE